MACVFTILCGVVTELVFSSSFLMNKFTSFRHLCERGFWFGMLMMRDSIFLSISMISSMSLARFCVG